uniref:OprD family porin n=1 Tax=Pseudomonas sp. RL_15y_Pfl2_60 TaxID=3088709 RepID=UPI0030DC6688
MIAAAMPSLVSATTSDVSEGFIEDSEFSILNRNYYFNRDVRKGGSSPTGNGYSEAWAQGIIAQYASGYTQGPVGFGVDAHAMLGLKLDTGSGRARGTTLLPVDSNNQAEDEYSKVGGAVKMYVLDTEFKYGDVFPTTPVVQYGDSRLLPETFRGLDIRNTSIEGLSLQGGRLHAMSQPQNSSSNKGFSTFYVGDVDADWLGYFGGDYTVNKNIDISLYTSRLNDVWNQHYASMNLNYEVADNLALFGGFNYYKATDQGKQLLGSFDNDIYSTHIGFSTGPHRVTLSYQKNEGDDDFDYLSFSDSIYLSNSIQYSDFNSPNERSMMLRYDLDMATFGVPGLSFMARYASGRDADYSNANSYYARLDSSGNALRDQNRWERDFEARYTVQEGAFKDLSVRVRQATTRSDEFSPNLNEVRVITEYPLDII